MSATFGDRVRTAHADAWEVQGRLREHAGGGAARRRGIRLMASGLPHPQWNNGDVITPDADVEAARAFFAERGVPWGVRVPAGMEWPHGRHLFRKRLMGLQAGDHRAAAAVPGLDVRPAAPGDLGRLADMNALGFGSEAETERAWLEPLMGAPRATVAVAALGGEPVATGYALRSDGDAGASLYVAGVVVLPHARGRGVGAHLTSWLVARGLAAGAALAHLHPDTDAAARVYARLGFVETPGLDVYVEL